MERPSRSVVPQEACFVLVSFVEPPLERMPQSLVKRRDVVFRELSSVETVGLFSQAYLFGCRDELELIGVESTQVVPHGVRRVEVRAGHVHAREWSLLLVKTVQEVSQAVLFLDHAELLVLQRRCDVQVFW